VNRFRGGKKGGDLKKKKPEGVLEHATPRKTRDKKRQGKTGSNVSTGKKKKGLGMGAKRSGIRGKVRGLATKSILRRGTGKKPTGILMSTKTKMSRWGPCTLDEGGKARGGVKTRGSWWVKLKKKGQDFRGGTELSGGKKGGGTQEKKEEHNVF